MLYVFRSGTGILADVDQRRPAAFVAAGSDFSDELVISLRQRGIVGIAV